MHKRLFPKLLMKKPLCLPYVTDCCTKWSRLRHDGRSQVVDVLGGSVAAAIQRTHGCLIHQLYVYIYIYIYIYIYTKMYIGTCEASRFDSNSNRTIPIRFDSIRKWRADSKFSNKQHLPSYHKQRSLFNKKNFNRCTVVIEIYFMVMILCLCSNSIHTR